MTVKKTRCNGQWTEARFRGFIMSALRSASTRWAPKQLCIKNARIKRGVYVCEHCEEETPASLPPLPGNKRRRKGIAADHINPIVPTSGFTSWDDVVCRMFVELDGYQALCWDCHTLKTNRENSERRLLKKLREGK